MTLTFLIWIAKSIMEPLTDMETVEEEGQVNKGKSKVEK